MCDIGINIYMTIIMYNKGHQEVIKLTGKNGPE